MGLLAVFCLVSLAVRKFLFLSLGCLLPCFIGCQEISFPIPVRPHPPFSPILTPNQPPCYGGWGQNKNHFGKLLRRKLVDEIVYFVPCSHAFPKKKIVKNFAISRLVVLQASITSIEIPISRVSNMPFTLGLKPREAGQASCLMPHAWGA